MRFPLGSAALVGVAWWATACGGSAPGSEATHPGRSPRAGSRETISLPRTIVTERSAASVDETFERGQRAFAEAHWREAADAFDRVAELDPDGALAVPSLFHAGWAHDNAGAHEAALRRYRGVVERAPRDELALEAAVRALRLLLYLDRVEGASPLADWALERAERLGDVRRMVALTARALARLGGGAPDPVALDEAEGELQRARAIVERLGLARGGTLHRDVAQLFFAVGELRRHRARALVPSGNVETFARELEERCQILLDAQSAYSDAMRAHDAHWSAKAGYRVGELYRDLHRDLMAMQRPAAAVGQRAALFEGAMRLRYSVLLEKGLRMMKHTLAMAESTGEESEWVDRARQAVRDMTKAMEKEEAAIQALPYDRATLKRALAEVAERAGEAPRGAATRTPADKAK